MRQRVYGRSLAYAEPDADLPPVLPAGGLLACGVCGVAVAPRAAYLLGAVVAAHRAPPGQRVTLCPACWEVETGLRDPARARLRAKARLSAKGEEVSMPTTTTTSRNPYGRVTSIATLDEMIEAVNAGRITSVDALNNVYGDNAVSRAAYAFAVKWRLIRHVPAQLLPGEPKA